MPVLRGNRYLPGCQAGFSDIVSMRQEIEAGWLAMPETDKAEREAKAARGRECYEACLKVYQKLIPSLSPAELAFLGCNDRFFLLTSLLNRRDAVHPWLYARCREVEADPDGHIDLWARFHYKSTIITFAGAIQEILCNPEITIGIFGAKNEVALPFLKQIMEELERNEKLKALYPDVLWRDPKKEAKGQWSADEGIVVKRKSNPKERTVEAFGLIDGMPAGRHFQLLIYDDLVTEKLVTNPDMIRKCTERWELSLNLGSGDSTRRWVIGTRYHFGDTYGIMLERGSVRPRIYPATDNGKLDGKPVFMSPEGWSNMKRDQRGTIAAQLLQNPLAGKESTFDPHALRGYLLRPRNLNVYIMGDPSMGKRAKTTDRTAIAVVGVDANNNKYLLDGFCHRMKPSERWMNLKLLYKRWHGAHGVQFVKVGWERYGMQSDLQYFEEKMMEPEAPVFSIEELNWTRENDQSKVARYGRLEPDFREGSFMVPMKVWKPDAEWVGKDGKLASGPRTCLWSVDPDTAQIEYRALAMTPGGQPVMTKVETQAKNAGEGFRIIEPIRRRDEDGNIYDVTRMFFEEYLFAPFSPHDDFIDAMSRIYDMSPNAPKLIDETLIRLPEYVD
jgi:hypothetical protein